MENSTIQNFLPNQWVLEQNESTVPEKGLRGLNWKGKIGFTVELYRHKMKMNSFLRAAFRKKECFVGPFYGEFGNFLANYVPFVSYLHKNNVKVTVCVLDRYLPFLKNQKGENIYQNAYILNSQSLKDLPLANGNFLKVVPPDFVKVIDDFKASSKKNNQPLLDLGNSNFYWFSYRNWQLEGKQHFYDLSNSVSKKNKVVIFPRKKMADYTRNNGEAVDFYEIADILSNYFDEVAFIGNPDMSDLNIQNKINSKIKWKVGDNEAVIKECCEAKLIVSQHSGAIHVGMFTRTPALVYFKGVLPIQGLDDTIRFRKNQSNSPLYLVTRNSELHEFCKLYTN